MSQYQILLNLFVAFALGSLIGMERQLRQRIAGLRTNALVATGAALFVEVSQLVPSGGDLTRVASYVVSGIGFLGAGVILKEGPTISGLNTAATLWCSAAIGVLSGFGLYPVAVEGTIFVILTHLLLRPLALKLNSRHQISDEEDLHCEISAVCEPRKDSDIRSFLVEYSNSPFLNLEQLRFDRNMKDGLLEVKACFRVRGSKEDLMEEITRRLRDEDGVSRLTWSLAPSKMCH